MSQSLYMRPVEKDKISLDDPLKFVLRKRFEGRRRVFSNCDLEYLAGLADGGVEGVEKLIGCIVEWGEVEVWKE